MVWYSMVLVVVVVLLQQVCADKGDCGEQLCGEVLITYPFGIGLNCSLNDYFAVKCHNSSAYHYKPKPILTKLKLELIEAYHYGSYNNVFGRQMTVKMRVARVCSGNSHEIQWSRLNLSGSPFEFSTTSNVFVSVGCHGTASLYNQRGKFVSGCSSTCSPPRRVIDGCNGYDYCQADLPDSSFKDGVYSVWMTGGSNKSCKSAFLTSKALLQTDNSTVVGAIKMTSDDFLVPVVLMYDIPVDLVVTPVVRHYIILAGILIIVFIVCVVFVTLLVSWCCFRSCWRWRTKKQRKETKLRAKYFKGILAEQRSNDVDKTKLFTVKELKRATDNFNRDRILGEGGQGSVYKGILKNGQVIAVKRGKGFEENEWKQFINEVILLSQVRHKHVVKLLGCCLETKVPILVYEFVPNGSLSQHIHNSSNHDEYFSLTWEMRLRIASEVSGAIAYLHSSSSTPIYHRDVKSNNILLDEKYEAKVADFGISRAISVDQTHLTICVQGTSGYVDPEYIKSCQFSEKSDVYSFGVVLVELLTGQQPIRAMPLEFEERSLVEYFNSAMDRLDEILDPRLLIQSAEMSTKDTIMSVSILAKRCLNIRGLERPTMKEVAIELEGLVKSSYVLIVPQQVSLEIDGSENQSSMETSAAYTCSDTGTTIIL